MNLPTGETVLHVFFGRFIFFTTDQFIEGSMRFAIFVVTRQRKILMHCVSQEKFTQFDRV